MDSMLSISQKNELLKSFAEIEMHKELKILFERIYPKKEIYITHGQNEFGKDLMILENDILETIVTSIVVKMDKLSGSATDKAVQEIRTQVSQSLKHPTYIKEIGKSYTANKVILIIFGEVSNNAEANLKIELGESFNNTKILNLNDIRQLFENYYPGIFLGASGTVVLIERITHIDKELLVKNKFLNETYISPLLRHYPITRQDLMRSALVTSSDTKSVENLRDTICGHKLDIEGFTKHISEKHGNFYIEGDAGSGKSVFILKLVQSLLKQQIQELDSASMKKTNKIYVPVFLKATELKNGKINHLPILINSQYNDSNASLVINLLIIDGIDEVKDIDRLNIIQACEEYTNHHEIKLIITGRKNPSTKKTLSKYHYYEILALEKAQAIEFLKKSLQRNQMLLSSLLRGLDQLENQIPFYPMALSLLVELVIQHEEVPSTITELYGKYIDLALGATGHNIQEIESLYAPFIKKDFLSLLAYEGFFLNGSIEIKRDDFNNILRSYVSSRAHIDSPESFFSDLERIAVLVLDDNYVKFSHKSFLDYMLATYFSEKREVLEEAQKFDKIYELYHRPLWDDVVNFFFGLKKEITRHQIDEIVSAGKKICVNNASDCDINNFFLGRLLQYAWNTDSEVKEYAIEIGINESLNIKKQLFITLTEDLGILGVPEIFGDVALLQMMELSYASKFVTIETDTVLQKKINLVKEGDVTTLDNNKSFIYFAALFLISNHRYLSQTTKNVYLSNLLALEKKMAPEMSLTLFQLLTVFQDKKKFFTNEHLLENINLTIKKLRKKFMPIAQRLFVFKNKIDKNNIDKLRNNFLKKRK